MYIAAFAPDTGDSLGSLLKSMSPSDIGPALVPDAGGFLFIDRAKFHDVFAKDVSPAEARIGSNSEAHLRAHFRDVLSKRSLEDNPLALIPLPAKTGRSTRICSGLWPKE